MSPERPAPRRRARGSAAAAAEHLQRSETWNGVRAGDPVVVAGQRVREAEWEFRAHVLNLRNGTESIEVIGGPAGHRRVRSFEPDRIFPVTGSGRAGGRSTRTSSDKPSLAEAPQLPLG